MDQNRQNILGRQLGKWQFTINNDGHRITVKMRTRFSQGNFNGFKAIVTDNLGNKLDQITMTTDPKEAQDRAFCSFVKKFC